MIGEVMYQMCLQITCHLKLVKVQGVPTKLHCVAVSVNSLLIIIEVK